MDALPPYTPQTATSPQNSGSGNGQALQGGNGIFSGIAGLSFMDLIFAHLSQSGNTDTEITPGVAQAETTPGQSDNSLAALLKQLKQGDDPAIEQVLAHTDLAGQADPLSAEQVLKTLETIIPAEQKPALQQAALQQIAPLIASLTQAVPQQQPVTKPKTSVQTTQPDLAAPDLKTETDTAGPLLIATGLTPETLTRIIEGITSGQTDGTEAGEGFMAFITQIVTPPQERKDVVFLPRGSVAGEINTPATQSSVSQAETMAAKLNALTIGADESPFDLDSDFEQILRVLETAQGKAGAQPGNDNALPKGLEKLAHNIKAHLAAGMSTVQGTPPPLTSMFTAFSADSLYPDGLDFSLGGPQSLRLTLTGPAQAASLIGQAQQAALPHPGTQMIASTIARATVNGENRNITLQLDPPDLGRVQVRMEFNKENNTLRAIMTAEKPETFMMLQRDAHALERALQDAGLDADGSSLEFELSQDGGLFDHEDRGGPGGQHGGGSGGDETAGDEQEIEVIQTTMDWYVDPDTGLMRYDALV